MLENRKILSSMSRRALLSLTGAAWSVGGLAACGFGVKEARPSVILVSIDTLRADHMGLYGYGRATTPFLDRFAKGCLVFERAFTPATWTLIAHMTMLTGLLPVEHGVLDEELALSPEMPLLTERLQTEGYQTIGLYYSGWIHERFGFSRGFDVFRSHENAAEAGMHLAEAIRTLDRDRPYFLFLHLFDVHSAPFDEENRTIYCAPSPYGGLFLTESSAALPDRPTEEIWETDGLLDPAQIDTLVAHYDGGVRYVDSMLETWFGDLERDGLMDGTLAIVTADHGEALGQRRGRLQGHGGLNQEGLHVPLIVRHPLGHRAGERVRQPVQLADIAPTIIATAGLSPDPLLGGVSLFGELPAGRVLTGSRKNSSYLLQWPKKLRRTAKGTPFELDLQSDPLENRPSEASEQDFSRLLAEALGGRGPHPAPVPVAAMSTEERDDLGALGYGGEVEDP